MTSVIHRHHWLPVFSTQFKEWSIHRASLIKDLFVKISLLWEAHKGVISQLPTLCSALSETKKSYPGGSGALITYNLFARGIFATRENLQAFFASTPAIERIKQRMAVSSVKSSSEWQGASNQSSLIVRVKNGPNEEGALAIEATPPIALEQIQDVSLTKKRFLFLAKMRGESQIELKSNRGICRGMCDWFVYLYLNTKPNSPNLSTESHVIAVAKEFERGGGVESVVLHRALLVCGGKILGLKTGQCIEEKGSWLGKEGVIEDIYDPNSSIHLTDGIFQVHFNRHTCVFLKISDHLSFFSIQMMVSLKLSVHINKEY